MFENKSLPVPFPSSYWVIPGLFLAGEYPGAKNPAEANEKIKSLFDAGIRHFVNLMEPDETDHNGKPFKPYDNILTDPTKPDWNKTSFIRFPIRDLGITSPSQMAEILNSIDEAISCHKPVYIHCWGGVGRTGTVVGCFLIRHGLANSDNVLDVIRQLRKDDLKSHRASPETKDQIEFIKSWHKHESGPPTKLNRYLGCMIGGAVGDALGAPVEFMSLSGILEKYGESGITDYDRAYGRIGAITDDTQMTLFTAEGLLRASTRGNLREICHPPSVVFHAYKRWLQTQDKSFKEPSAHEREGFLHHIEELYSRRAPGNSCLSALRREKMGTIKEPINDSKGCGGVMRIAPVGLIVDDVEESFKMGCEIAALTHGHPTGYLASGALATIINVIKNGGTLGEAVNASVSILKKHPHHEETAEAIDHAVGLVGKSKPVPETIEKLGGGWIAEEALAISLYCAMCFQNDFSKGVLLAVNHSGDSDSTGAITGNILGCLRGSSAIPSHWLKRLELKNVIQEIGVELFIKLRNDRSWWEKYPGY